MICFANKPDSVCEKILSGTLETIITDCEAVVQSGDDDLPYLSAECFRVFGGPRTLLGVLKKFKAAYDAKEMYEVSQCYNYLIDEIVTAFVMLYNDGHSMIDDVRLVHPSGRTIEYIERDMLLDFLLPDRDYDFDPSVAQWLMENEHANYLVGAAPDALTIARRMPPDLADLWIRRCEELPEDYGREEPDWFDEWGIEE